MQAAFNKSFNPRINWKGETWEHFCQSGFIRAELLWTESINSFVVPNDQKGLSHFFCLAVIIFSVYIHAHYNHTHFQHVLLGIFSVGKELHEQSGAKAIGHSWKVHLGCPSIPVVRVTSNTSTRRDFQGQGTPTNNLKSLITQPFLHNNNIVYWLCWQEETGIKLKRPLRAFQPKWMNSSTSQILVLFYTWAHSLLASTRCTH